MARTRFTKTVTALASVLMGVTLLAGCASTDPDGPSATAPADLLAEHGLDGLDAREVVTRLDAMPVADRPADLIASVKPRTVELSDSSGATTSLALPDDQFYVSIAPYVDRTHECYFHSLTTCLGEMPNEDVQVEVVDRATGAVLVDEALRVNDNGFFGLWLPRAVDATVTVESGGRSTTSEISTHDDDPTCVTTLQLA
ncbi:CueP family metal-binding protein [Prescottella defluvii]|uniref:CueP family metal-binding protein n=1 Tax=Prescottella defluvii TaxID=1323361 RepID=UPI0004F2851C|nr:CueP family metal-binding protein [Prescottella defluvii]